MAGGEVCFKLFTKTTEPQKKRVRLDVPAFLVKECCFNLPALAKTSGGDSNTNDRHSILKRYDKNLYTDVIPFLQKRVNGIWVDQVALNTDAYGTSYGLGSFKNAEDTLNYVGYKIEWQEVLSTFGEGDYRFRFHEVDFQAVETESFHIFEFCLKQYLPHRADGTVRFTWYTKGYRGDFENDQDVWDFTNVAAVIEAVENSDEGWFNQIRLPDSFFGFNKASYERELLKYSNGQMRWIKDEQVESFEFHSGMFPSDLHDYIKTEIIQADRILVSDYNSKNPNIVVEKAINPSGSYEPSWNKNNLRAMVSVDFEEEFQLKRKTRC